MKFAQRTHQRRTATSDSWEQPWPLPGADTVQVDLDAIDEVLAETET